MSEAPRLLVERVLVSDLKTYPDNPRRGDTAAIAESLKAHGQYRPLVVQRSTGYVLAGNHTLKAALDLGWEEIEVTRLDVDDDAARRIVLVDNRSNDLARYDDDELVALLASLDGDFTGTGFDADDLDALLAGEKPVSHDEDIEYSAKVESPVYEPVGPMPPLSALADYEVRDRLLQEIAEAETTEDVKEFLRAAAYRHTRFDYETIANYYAHAPAAVQRLMEASALVIIDYEQAIERGFVRLDAEVAEAFAGDYPDA